MSLYSELVKNFERVRAYMREFYVYGFKSREEYDTKSARTYDDERRRIESWLGDYMGFVRTPEGKNVFLSIDSRAVSHNPLFKAWKAKSFTDGDITLHFFLFDLLSEDRPLTLTEILDRIDADYLAAFDAPMTFDESTVRKKLKEYEKEGIVRSEKDGRRTLYRRAPALDVSGIRNALDFFSEVLPCGVVGSFLLDKLPEDAPSAFGFKHHYVTGTVDSEILATLFDAMRKKCTVTVKNLGRGSKSAAEHTVVPLRILISVQSGRQYLAAYHIRTRTFRTFRLDYVSDVTLLTPAKDFDQLRAALAESEARMWGVLLPRRNAGTERVSFTVAVGEDESYVVDRLMREKRCGTVEQIGDGLYRFTAEVVDATELFPWIRTFFSRITELHCSNRESEERFLSDLDRMYRVYGIGDKPAEGGDAP